MIYNGCDYFSMSGLIYVFLVIAHNCALLKMCKNDQKCSCEIPNHVSRRSPRKTVLSSLTTEKRITFNTFSDHHSDVIISAMASQVTGVSIVYSTVCSGADQRKYQFSVTGLCEGNSPVTGEFPAQRASNAENISI